MTVRVVLLLLCSIGSLCAQTIRPLPSAKVYAELKKLKSMTSVLYIAAHPDDENTRLLSWLATGQHIRTAYMSITRGDGGQNIIGGEQGAALGIIRTYELLEARKLDGAEQYFGRAVDFGFSKTSEETFKHWDRIALIADVVRTIREFKPDVVICRFPKDSLAGHGQHAASAIIAEDAFKYCLGTLDLPQADLDSIEKGATRGFRAKEQWKPSRLLYNALRFGNRSVSVDGMFKLDVGQYDPTIGLGYGELAGISRSLHKSQGAGTQSTPGIQPEFFATLSGAAPTKSLFDGIDTTWNRIGRSDIEREIDAVIAAFDMTHPERSTTALLKIRRSINELKDAYWRKQKIAEIERIILSCIGFMADASVSAPFAVEGASDTLSVTIRVTSRAGKPVSVKIKDLKELNCEHDSLVSITSKFSGRTTVSAPYWLTDTGPTAASRERQLPNDAPLPTKNSSAQPPTINTGTVSRSTSLFAFGDIIATRPSMSRFPLRITIDQDTITTSIPISYKKLDPLRGDVFEELRVVPIVSVEPMSTVSVGTTQPELKIRLRAFSDIQNATIRFLDGTKEVASVSGINVHGSTDTLVTLTPNVTKNSVLTVQVDVKGKTYSNYVKTISYDHIPTIQYLEPAEVNIVTEQVKITAKRIAYVAGAGEFAPEFLRGMGVVVDEIDEATMLKTQELLKYDAVLVGIRAINTNKNMKYLMPALMHYVEEGGTLVMQYNTMQTMSTKDLGPYPLPLTNKRVTEEDANVTILTPGHALLSTPNPITQTDFNGWVQERGLYFPFEFDPKYEALLSMHDTKEQPLNGALLYAKHGKGHYVYCALSLFRQLPAGVPGAMKLLGNMLSL